MVNRRAVRWGFGTGPLIVKNPAHHVSRTEPKGVLVIITVYRPDPKLRQNRIREVKE